MFVIIKRPTTNMTIKILTLFFVINIAISEEENAKEREEDDDDEDAVVAEEELMLAVDSRQSSHE